MIKLSPSLLAANPLSFGEEVLSAASSGCDELHFDVMDAHFVPNLSFGPHILKAIRAVRPIILDVHLMLDNPMSMLDAFIEAGADIITVHAEAFEAENCLRFLRSKGIKAGFSLKPATSVESVRNLLPMCDRILLMTVEPGFGGQKLIPEVLEKAILLRNIGFQKDIEADGGINEQNASELVSRGVNVLVMGTGFFKNNNREQLVQRIHQMT